MDGLPCFNVLRAGNRFTATNSPHTDAWRTSRVDLATSWRYSVDRCFLLHHDILQSWPLHLDALPLIFLALEKLGILIDCSAVRPTLHAQVLQVSDHGTVAAWSRYAEELLQEVIAAERWLVRPRLMLLLLEAFDSALNANLLDRPPYMLFDEVFSLLLRALEV